MKGGVAEKQMELQFGPAVFTWSSLDFSDVILKFKDRCFHPTNVKVGGSINPSAGPMRFLHQQPQNGLFDYLVIYGWDGDPKSPITGFGVKNMKDANLTADPDDDVFQIEWYFTASSMPVAKILQFLQHGIPYPRGEE